jgi:hypothetical protein
MAQAADIVLGAMRRVCGDAGADHAIAEALRASGLDRMPEDSGALRAWIDVHLRGVLRRSIGSILARAVLDALDAAMLEEAPPSRRITVRPPPPSESGALLVVDDRGSGAGFAAMLPGAELRLVDELDPSELGERAYAAIVVRAADMVTLERLQTALEAYRFTGAVVLATDHHSAAAAILREWGAVRVLPYSATPAQIAACVRELL